MKREKTSHLTVDERSGNSSQKERMFKQWGISIVNYRWLLECTITNAIVDASDFSFDDGQETLSRMSLELMRTKTTMKKQHPLEYPR